MIPESNLQAFMADLAPRVAGDLRTDTYSKLLYSTDASLYQVMPYGVLIPQTMADVQATVELAAERQIPLLPRIGGSSLAGQAVNEALIIDMSKHLANIVELNPAERWVRVQPGVVLDDLNDYLKPWGLQFGPDPASSNRAGMGGLVANNSTGSHSILYGMTADHVLETKLILSDGRPAHFQPLTPDQVSQYRQRSGLEGQIYETIWQMSRTQAETIRAKTPRHWRRCGGYNLDRFVDGVSYQSSEIFSAAEMAQAGQFNLSHLMCGSEGTLGVMTEIKLNLVPRPKMTALALIHFADLRTALTATPTVLQVNPSAVELMDNLGLTMCRQVPAYARLLSSFIEGQPHSLLITEFYGDSEAELQAKLDRLRQHLQREKVGQTHIVPVIDPATQANVWSVRKAGLGLLMSVKGDYKPIPFIEDSAVPVEHLADYVAQIERFCHELGTKIVYYAHASGGCLHIRPLMNTKLATEVDKLPQISRFAVELLGQYGGTWSSEHGDGRARSWLNEPFFGRELYELYRQVKQTFDPHNIFNPGNIVAAGPMTDNLRYGPTYEVIPLTEQLDFSEDQGFHRAVEMCNGAGVCRQRSSGTMCPSFMVTQDEEHSTRGRANALRAALSGRLPASELTSQRMYEVLDLCISCKACKAECPSSVDMAKIKFEFLTHYYEQHGVTLRAKLFGDIHFLSHLSSGLPAPLVNRLLTNGLVKRLLAQSLGISRQRTLPQFANEPFTRWFKLRHQPPRDRQARPKVVLFNDTFHTFNYPHIAIAATELLEAAGFEVLLPGHRCCGRPMISKGLVNEARRAARQTIARLTPFARQGLPIVGLEPSCLLSMRDDYYFLLPGDERVDLVAKHCFTFEEFIAQLADRGELRWQFKPASQQVLLHGHCHQKALVGTQPSRQILALPGYTVNEVDSGCCGMAGSFGYEAEHYEVSLAMGERRLFPAVREQLAGTFIVAAGVSCRQQINHATGRHVLHPAEVLRAALA